MPIVHYSVLKGKPTMGQIVQGNSPHFQIRVQAGHSTFTVAVNIQSVDKSEVLYYVDHAFDPPAVAKLLALPVGMTVLQSVPGGLALDFVRETVNGTPMVEKSAMHLLPKMFLAGSRHNDIGNELADLVKRAIADPNGTAYAFGSAFADSGQTTGIHDIHMNQGNALDFHGSDNGIWQDGALFVDLPAQHTWIAVFIAFQTQSWKTDNHGNPV